MTNNNNDHGYDELRWLAKDTRTKRRRTMWWTAGLVLGAMAVATAYVRSNSDSPGPDPRPVVTDSQNINTRITNPPDLAPIVAALNGIRTELQQLNEISPGSVSFGVLDGNGLDPQITDSSSNLRNVVWLVDGSRRVPMTRGDVIWVPELERRYRLDTIGPEPGLLVTELVNMESGVTLGPLPRRVMTRRGIASCVQITWRGPSQRTGFRTGNYVDIELEFFNADTVRTCTNPFDPDPVPVPVPVPVP